MKKRTFESAMARLEEIVSTLNSQTLPLEESLALFKEGAELVAYCNKQLGDAKLKIETFFPEQAGTKDA